MSLSKKSKSVSPSLFQSCSPSAFCPTRLYTIIPTRHQQPPDLAPGPAVLTNPASHYRSHCSDKQRAPREDFPYAGRNQELVKSETCQALDLALHSSASGGIAGQKIAERRHHSSSNSRTVAQALGTAREILSFSRKHANKMHG